MSRYFVHCPLNFAKKQLNIDHHVCLNFSQNCLCHSHCLWHPIAISQKCEGGMRMSNWACSIRTSPAVSKKLMRARMKLLLVRVKYIEDESIKSKMKMKVFQDADDDESIVGVRVNAPFLWVGSHALPLWTSSPQLLTLSSEYLYTWYYNMYIITIVNKPSIAPTIVNFESWNTWALELANWQTCRGATIVNSNLNIEKLNLWTAMSQH